MSFLLDKLVKDVEDRESVLFEIEKVLFTRRYNLSLKHQSIFTVQSISMIYSLWEGFIQNAFNLYIDQLNQLEIDHNCIRNELLVYSLETNFKQFFSYPDNQKKKVQFYNNLKHFFSFDKIKFRRGISTESNVGFNILNKILSSFCLETFPEHWNIYKHPQPNLKEMLMTFLRYRNGIAHGGDISSEEKVSHETFIKYKRLIIDLMYEVIFRINKGLEQRTYLK